MTFAGITPSEIRIERANNFVSMFIEESEVLTHNSQYHSIRLCVRIVARLMLNCHDCAIVGGSRFVRWFEDELDELGWKVGDTFIETRLGVAQGLGIHAEQVSWFFERPPSGFSDVRLDQAFVTDSICLLGKYRGPTNLDDIFEGVSNSASQAELCSVLLKHCESILIVNDDGCTVEIVISNELEHHLRAKSDDD